MLQITTTKNENEVEIVESINGVIDVEKENAEPNYISFGFAAKVLGVRYQQVYSRAVTKNKMRWIERGLLHVHLDDVKKWNEIRQNATIIAIKVEE
jgi:hypothetical protein